jgi:hypothetical protein
MLIKKIIKKKLVLGVVYALMLSGLQASIMAKPIKLNIPTIYGEIEVGYDTSKIGTEKLKRVLRISPYCTKNEIDVVWAFGSPKSQSDEAYFERVEAVVAANKKNLIILTDNEFPAVLKTVVDFYKRQIGFYLWLNESKATYYKTLDTGVLSKGFDWLDFEEVCGSIIVEINEANNFAEKRELISFDWHNAVNSAYQDAFPSSSYPRAAWDAFIKKYKITVKELDGGFI